jgi:hypothetical protein
MEGEFLLSIAVIVFSAAAFALALKYTERRKGAWDRRRSVREGRRATDFRFSAPRSDVGTRGASLPFGATPADAEV